MRHKLGDFFKIVYGYGIMIALFAGGGTFLGYLMAFILGGDIATQICVCIYTQIMPVIIYVASIAILFGLLAMYLCGEVALVIQKTKSNN